MVVKLPAVHQLPSGAQATVIICSWLGNACLVIALPYLVVERQRNKGVVWADIQGQKACGRIQCLSFPGFAVIPAGKKYTVVASYHNHLVVPGHGLVKVCALG